MLIMERCSFWWRILVCLFTYQVCRLAESSDDFFGKELFSFKTPYLWTRQTIENNEDLSFIQYNGQTCPVVYVDGLYRHGARYPNHQWSNRMDELMTLLRKGTGINQFVREWVNTFTPDKELELSSVGEDEMKVVGRRLGSRYHTFLLHKQMDKIRYYSSKTNRAVDSVTHFQIGLGSRMGVNIATRPDLDNTMLRFYEKCKLYKETIEADDAMQEYNKFLAGTEIDDVVAAVNNRVNGGYFNLTLDQVWTISRICAFELAFFNTSDWCDYLSLEDLKVLEYAGDIQAGLERGYFYPITSRMTCPLLSHIYKQMDDVISGKAERPLASFRFGHTGSLLPVYAALHLFNETGTLLASDYEANANRGYRIGRILPFSANIVFSLYKCGNEYMVKLMVNEEEVVIPACGTSVCAYRTVRERYSDYVDCDFNKVCENDVSPNRGSTLTRCLHVVVTLMAVMCILLL